MLLLLHRHLLPLSKTCCFCLLLHEANWRGLHELHVLHDLLHELLLLLLLLLHEGSAEGCGGRVELLLDVGLW